MAFSPKMFLVRRYLTSIAVHEVGNMENGAFAPDGIISVQEGRGLIQEGADNIDLNTETIDGKEKVFQLMFSIHIHDIAQ
jgi:hypothetical protein